MRYLLKELALRQKLLRKIGKARISREKGRQMIAKDFAGEHSLLLLLLLLVLLLRRAASWWQSSCWWRLRPGQRVEAWILSHEVTGATILLPSIGEKGA